MGNSVSTLFSQNDIDGLEDLSMIDKDYSNKTYDVLTCDTESHIERWLTRHKWKLDMNSLLFQLQACQQNSVLETLFNCLGEEFVIKRAAAIVHQQGEMCTNCFLHEAVRQDNIHILRTCFDIGGSEYAIIREAVDQGTGTRLPIAYARSNEIVKLIIECGGEELLIGSMESEEWDCDVIYEGVFVLLTVGATGDIELLERVLAWEKMKRLQDEHHKILLPYCENPMWKVRKYPKIMKIMAKWFAPQYITQKIWQHSFRGTHVIYEMIREGENLERIEILARTIEREKMAAMLTIQENDYPERIFELLKGKVCDINFVVDAYAIIFTLFDFSLEFLKTIANEQFAKQVWSRKANQTSIK